MLQETDEVFSSLEDVELSDGVCKVFSSQESTSADEMRRSHEFGEEDIPSEGLIDLLTGFLLHGLWLQGSRCADKMRRSHEFGGFPYQRVRPQHLTYFAHETMWNDLFVLTNCVTLIVSLPRSHEEIATLLWSTSVDEKRSSQVTREKVTSQRSTSAHTKNSSQVSKVDLDWRRTKLSSFRGCRLRRELQVLLVLLMICSSSAFPPDVHVEPNVRYLTIWEGDSQVIDCHVTHTEKTGDLRWTKRYPEQSSCPVDSRTDDNGDGTFTIHRLLIFKSFTSSDAGIYTCTFIPRPGFGSQYEIKLIFQEMCEAGKYGLGCSSSCSEFCKEINTPGKESPCSYKDGHCLHGCLPGYRGANCSSVCEPGKYGPDCSLTCNEFCKGNGSLDKPWCDHNTGICLDGCQDGFTGKSCTTYYDANYDADFVTVVVLAVALNIYGLILIIFYIIHRNWERLYLCIKRKLLTPQPSTRSVIEEESVHLRSPNDDDPPSSQTSSSDSAYVDSEKSSDLDTVSGTEVRYLSS